MKLTVEKMIYGGDGLARVEQPGKPNRKTVFVPFTLPGEIVEAEIVDEKAGFAHARLLEVLEPSVHRVPPPCKLFQSCGGCSYQHTDYPQQLQIKEEVLRETLRRTAKIDWNDAIKVHSAEPWRYRNRARFRVVKQGSEAHNFRFGFNRASSEEVLQVDECAILSPLLQRVLNALGEIKRPAALEQVQEVEFFTNADDTALLAEVIVNGSETLAAAEALEPWFEQLQNSVPELQGAAIFPSLAFAGAPEQAWEATSLDYSAAGNVYRVSAGSFFQANRFLIEAVVSAALDGAAGSSAWDLYSGVGLFSIEMLKRFRKVLAVESSKYAVVDLMHNVQVGGRGEFRVEAASTESFLGRAKTGLRPDFILLDPPRAGLGEKTAQRLAQAGAPHICYVSCDPATLARDLRVLTIADYKITAMHLIDLFPQTYHLETIVHLKR